MARYRLNTTKCVLKWPKKHQNAPTFNNITLSTLSDPPPLPIGEVEGSAPAVSTEGLL